MSYISKLEFAELCTKFFKNERYFYSFIRNSNELNTDTQKDCIIKMSQILLNQKSSLSVAKVKYQEINKSFDIGASRENMDNIYMDYYNLIIDIKNYDSKFDNMIKNHNIKMNSDEQDCVTNDQDFAF